MNLIVKRTYHPYGYNLLRLPIMHDVLGFSWYLKVLPIHLNLASCGYFGGMRE